MRPFSCPIALHAACSTAECVALRQINKVTGNDDPSLCALTESQ